MNFYFNGHYSTEFNVINVNIENSNGMLQETLFTNRTLNKEKLKYRADSYFQNIETDNRQITLQLAFKDGIVVTNSLLRAVQSWLLSPKSYADLWFLDDCSLVDGVPDITQPKRIYKAAVINSASINHFNLPEGYISDVTFETQSPYCDSLERGHKVWSMLPPSDDSEDGSIINFFNHGDFPIEPQMRIIVRQIEGTDPNNQEIKIIGRAIPNDILEQDKETEDGFNRIYNYKDYNYSNFPDFILSRGKKANGFFKLLGTVYYGEKFILGDKTYEFDLGYHKPYIKTEIDNILVPVNGSKAHNTLVFDADSKIDDASTVTIGDQVFEYDSNDIYSPTNVKVDISQYMGRAKGILHLNSNMIPEQKVKIGDITYVGKSGTREDVIKMTDHLLSDFTESVYNVQLNQTSLTNNSANVSNKTSKNIANCLVRNITRSPSDLGIRKMGYINKDFVWVLNSGESDTDYQEEIDNVPIAGRILIAFQEPIDSTTINNDTIQVRDSEGNLINCNFSMSTNDGGKTVAVIPVGTYEYDTDYYIFVSPEVKTEKGISYNKVKRIKFHTVTENDSDITHFDQVPVTKVFYIYSAQKINSDTMNNEAIYVTKDGSSSQVLTSMSLINSGKTISIAPNTIYDYESNYTLHITTELRDIDGNIVVQNGEEIHFTTQSQINSTHVDLDFIPLGNVPISETIKIPLDDKIDKDYINRGLVGSVVTLLDDDNNNVPIDISIDTIANNVLNIDPKKPLNYNSYYFLYVSQAIKLNGKNNILAPLRYKLITETEEYAKTNLSDKISDELTDSEKGDKTALQDDLDHCNIDKTIVYHCNQPLYAWTVNTNNVWVLDSNGDRVDITVELTADSTGIQIFPNPVWKNGESYSVFINNKVQTSTKPRVFVGSAPPDGDFENAQSIFGIGFDVIKTNGYTVQGNTIIDTSGNTIVFRKNDIVVQTDGGLQASDFNSDGTVKDGTAIISIPSKGINTANASNLAKTDRNKTKIAMQEYFNAHKDEPYVVQQLTKEDKEILTFTTQDNSQAISVNIDSSIFLPNSSITNKDIKKIKGMIPGDNIDLYETHERDFKADPNALIPSSIPVGAKVYAGKSPIAMVHGVKDDYENAKDILAPLGYTIIDSTAMSLADKKQILFRPFDLVIGGVLAGTKVTDFDASTGNLLTTPPKATDPNDTRVTRVTGIPMEVNIYPAQRIQGAASNPGREGTQLAMQEFADQYNKERKGGTLGDEYESNICPQGITLIYKVPENSKVYGAGTDLYNAIRYLNGFGFDNFVNVGLMSDNDKNAIGFTSNDIVVGGTGASDRGVTSDGQAVTVKGIGNIPLNGATRLGGIDRNATELAIKKYSEGLKIKSIAAGDIVKLQITINNPENMINNINGEASGDDPAQANTGSTITESTKIEYHIVKSVTELSRNRVHVDFYENIRTTNYISAIEVVELYKLYNQRIAEDYMFDGNYQFKEENEGKNTLINLIKAINNTGTYGIEYSQGTYKHPMVLGQLLNESEMELDGLDYGSKYNIPISMIDRIDLLNRFLTPTLTGGKDCTQSNAIIALRQAILDQNDKKERYNKDQYNILNYTSTTLSIEHKMCGEKYNDIICLANVTQQYQTPYLITDTNTTVSNNALVNLSDFLNREKQIAKWDNDTLIEGEDSSIEECMNELKQKITQEQNQVVVDFDKLEDGTTDDLSKINITYNDYGEQGNLYMNTSCVNGVLSSKQLSGGLDGLQQGEEIIIDNKNNKIISSIGKDRYKNFNGEWLKIPPQGVQLINEKGSCTLEFAYTEKYYI